MPLGTEDVTPEGWGLLHCGQEGSGATGFLPGDSLCRAGSVDAPSRLPPGGELTVRSLGRGVQVRAPVPLRSATVHPKNVICVQPLPWGSYKNEASL